MAFCQGTYCVCRTKGNWKYIKAVFYPCILLGTTPKCAHNVHGQRDKSELVEVIGKVKEIKNNANGDCMGEVIRVRVSIDVTKPLMKILEIKKEDMYEEKGTPVLIRYERLPDFCYCCGCIGHQYRECAMYKNQPKEELAYGPWLKAPTMAEKSNQSRRRNKENDTENRSPEA